MAPRDSGALVPHSVLHAKPITRGERLSSLAMAFVRRVAMVVMASRSRTAARHGAADAEGEGRIPHLRGVARQGGEGAPKARQRARALE